MPLCSRTAFKVVFEPPIKSLHSLSAYVYYIYGITRVGILLKNNLFGKIVVLKTIVCQYRRRKLISFSVKCNGNPSC